MSPGIGFVLAALSMIAAAILEVKRKENLGFEQTVGEEVFFASNLTVFLQIPQFALVGCSEAFASISGLYELFFTTFAFYAIASYVGTCQYRLVNTFYHR